RGHLRFEVGERIRELRGDLPSGELAPHEPREDLGERLLLCARDVRSSVLLNQLIEDGAPVPDFVLSYVIDVLELSRSNRFVLAAGALEDRCIEQRSGHGI